MKGSRKISVRLPDGPMERLHEFCRETGSDLSHVVRQGLDTFLASQSGSATAEDPTRRLSPPEQVFDLVPRYLGWVRGDLREERKRLFRELLAASFVAKKHFPRTAGMLEGYMGVLQLCQFFGLE